MAASSLQSESLASSAHSEYELPAFTPSGMADAAPSIRTYKNSRRRYVFLAKHILSFCSFLTLFVLFASLAANTCFFSVLFALLLLATMAGTTHSIIMIFSVVIVVLQTAYALLYTVVMPTHNEA